MDLTRGLTCKVKKTCREIYAERAQHSGGTQSFLRQVDEKTRGFEPGTMGVYFGWTGAGKTLFGVNYLHGNVVQNKYNGVYITLEVPPEMIRMALLSRHSYESRFTSVGPVDKLLIEKAKLPADVHAHLFDMVETDLMNNPTHGKFEVLGAGDFESFTRLGIRKKLLNLGFVPDFIVLDHSQCFLYLEEAQAFRFNPVNHYVRIFAELAMDWDGSGHKFFAMMLSQANREGWKRAVEAGGVYDLTAIADANELERSGSYIVSVFVDDDLKASKEAKIQLHKNRMGEVVSEPVLVSYDARYSVIGHDAVAVTEGPKDLSGILTGGSMYGGYND